MTTMTSKGQVTIPKRMRDALGLRAGSNVEFEIDPDGRVYVKSATKRAKGCFEKLRGTMKGRFTTEEILRLTRGWS